MNKSFFSMVILFLVTISLAAQTGIIEGTIKDKKTGETLVGASVTVKGTTTGTITNLNGEFRLLNILPGSLDLQISYISYIPVIIENIKVARGQSVNVDVELDAASVEIDEVEITARRVTHTEVSILTTLRTSQVVVSGVSSQQIGRSQDSDAAEVARRVPGVTIVDGRFIVIRGLSERYNTVMLHNVMAPSMEPDVKSFSFDIIPSSQIDRLLIYKSPSADLPGDFAGGLSKVYTKSIPDKTGIEVSYSNNYRPGTTFNDYLIQEQGGRAWTGFNNNYFDLPDDFPDDLRTITNQPERLQDAGRSLRNNWLPVEKNAWLDQSFSLTGNLEFNLGKVKIGHITALNYSNSTSVLTYERNDFNAFDFINDRSLPIYNFSDNQSNKRIRVGVLHNYGVRFNNNHSLEIINLFNQNSLYRYTNRVGPHMDFGFSMNNHAFQQIFRGLYTGQVSGNHQVLPNTKIDWTVGIGHSNRELPDYKQFRSEKPVNDPGTQYFIYVPIGGAQPYFMGRFHSDMRESSGTYSGNIQQTIRLSEDHYFKPVIKAGIFKETRERDFRARNIGYTQAPGFIQGLREVSIDSLFHQEHINNWGGVKIDEQSNPQDSYSASNDLFAWYMMADLPLTPKLRVVAGVRFENNLRILNSATTSGPVNVDYSDKDILPSINASYNFSDRMLVRAAYGQTVNRPEFRENAPFGFFDFDFNYVISGYPFLLSADINNYDLRWEFYPNPSEIISFGVFYKRFENAIERVFLPGAGSGGSKNFSFGNSDLSEVYGAEIDARKSLAGLTGNRFINNLTVVFNAALMKSEVKIGEGSRSDGRDTDPRPLQGQSPYIVNAGLYYNKMDADLQINLLYNIIGPRIFSAGFTDLDKSVLAYPDIYEMPRHLLDLTVSKRLTRYISIKGGISDILDQKSLFIQDSNEDGIFDNLNDQIIRNYRPGRTFNVGLSLKF
jgi:outer membrane receptor for ferrienterochelin and colicin